MENNIIRPFSLFWDHHYRPPPLKKPGIKVDDEKVKYVHALGKAWKPGYHSVQESEASLFFPVFAPSQYSKHHQQHRRHLFCVWKKWLFRQTTKQKKKKGAERTLCSLRKTWLNVRHRARWQRARTLSAGTPTQDGYVLCGQMTELGSLPVISHPFEYSLCSLRAFFRNVFQDSGR